MVEQVNQEENPIQEADKESIDRLFNLDPQFLTRENVVKIVEVLRRNRGSWAADKKAKTSRAKAPVSKEAAADLLNQFALKF